MYDRAGCASGYCGCHRSCGGVRHGTPPLSRTLGILGTLVWDRIVPADGGGVTEAWGGIAYALASAVASLDAGWTVLPVVKVGADLEAEAREWLASLPGIDTSALTVVEAPNNRVELVYRDAMERTERLTGGVPPWSWTELSSIMPRCDALLVNFISGHEADLDTCRALRSAFKGPSYGDLHSLFLGTEPDGTRVPRRLDDTDAWVACFDAVQFNEQEARLAGADAEGGSEAFARGIVARGPRVASVTRGAQGVSWASRGDFESGVDGAPPPGRIESGSVTIRASRRGDPTGCGDVWGAACFARLLAGDPLRVAVGYANQLAERNVTHQGALGLYEILHEEVLP